MQVTAVETPACLDTRSLTRAHFPVPSQGLDHRIDLPATASAPGIAQAISSLLLGLHGLDRMSLAAGPVVQQLMECAALFSTDGRAILHLSYERDELEVAVHDVHLSHGNHRSTGECQTWRHDFVGSTAADAVAAGGRWGIDRIDRQDGEPDGGARMWVRFPVRNEEESGLSVGRRAPRCDHQVPVTAS
jgi:hypothetical protein